MQTQRQQYDRSRYMRLKQSGQCVHCQAKALPGKAECVDCKSANHIKHQARYKQLKSLNLCVECRQPLGAAKTRCLNCLDKMRDRTFQSQYNITVAQYHAMYQAQNGQCLICGIEKSSVGRGAKHGSDTLQVDHNHTTGTVRGLLCMPCNVFCGMLEKHAQQLTVYLHHIKVDTCAKTYT